MIWQVVVWNKRVLQGNGGVVIYIFIIIYLYCLYLACYPYEYIYIYIHTLSHLYTFVRKYILYAVSIFLFVISCDCHKIHQPFNNLT